MIEQEASCIRRLVRHHLSTHLPLLFLPVPSLSAVNGIQFRPIITHFIEICSSIPYKATYITLNVVLLRVPTISMKVVCRSQLYNVHSINTTEKKSFISPFPPTY